MKYNFDSYGLYKTGKIIRNVVRARVTMNAPVDLKVLRSAINKATKRYPYFMKRVTVNEEGAYVLVDNPLPIVVMRTRKKAPPTGSKMVNYHMLYVDTEGCDIFFTISHSLAGGKGIQPWIMTCIYQYVTEKYGVKIDAAGIRTPESAFLPTEKMEPKFAMLSKDKPIVSLEFPKAATLIKDYLNGFVNPFAKNEHYYLFTVNQSDFMKYCRETDSSVASLVSVLHFKAFDKVLPEKETLIRAGMAHNPCSLMGIPDAHSDFLSHIYVDYKREMAAYDMERLGTITRGQMIVQSDESCASVEVRNRLRTYKGIDRVHGLKNKRKYAKKNNKRAASATFNVNYTGYYDWGDLKEYVKSLVYIVDGHMLCEVSAVGDKIFIADMALVKSEKYIKALESVFRELNIPYELEGSFAKNLPWQDIPR